MGSFLLQNLLRNVDRLKNSFCGKSKCIPFNNKYSCKILLWFPAKQSLEQNKRAE